MGNPWCLPRVSEIIHHLAAADFDKMPWPALSDHVNGHQKKKKNSESKQLLVLNICESHNFFTNYILFNCLGLQDWVFSTA